MDDLSIRVLLLGESESGSGHLRRRLEKRGCRCWCARSVKEGLALHGEHFFDLILSTSPFQELKLLLAGLGNTSCTVFHCYPVEDGCWWVPVVRHGRKCFGAPGVRGSEFLGVLDQIVRDSSTQKFPLESCTQALSHSSHP